jgi:hypothetical protein
MNSSQNVKGVYHRNVDLGNFYIKINSNHLFLVALVCIPECLESLLAFISHPLPGASPPHSIVGRRAHQWGPYQA